MYVELLNFALGAFLGLDHFETHVLANLELLLSTLDSFLPELVLGIYEVLLQKPQLSLCAAYIEAISG